jgi:hypothetical protein
MVLCPKGTLAFLHSLQGIESLQLRARIVYGREGALCESKALYNRFDRRNLRYL